MMTRVKGPVRFRPGRARSTPGLPTDKNMSRVARIAIGLIALMGLVPSVSGRATESLLLRAENPTLLPHSLPIIPVRLRNAGETPYQGKLTLQGPATWRITPDAHEVQLAPGEEQRLTFAVQGGNEASSNAYPITVSARRGSEEVTRHQQIMVTGAPFYRPTIDGDPSDWQDAIPVRFVAHGKQVTIGTYWNRRDFSLLVAVEEDRLVRPGEAPVFDAVQFAISPQGTATGREPDEVATRFEYLLVAGPDGTGTCFELIRPGMKLSEAVESRPLEPLVYDQAKVAVGRQEGVTYYECSLPLAPMRDAIRPGEGREFQLSLLVHDPDGTGIRDWGEAAGLWESERYPLAWSRWIGARWGERPPLDCRTRWGMCSSRY
jgi:hypothetical protein